MGVLHFLDVGEGDCSIIQHPSDRVTMIDVCNARKEPKYENALAEFLSGLGSPPPTSRESALGTGHTNFLAELVPTPTTRKFENPISYMNRRNITSVFRYIQSHPEMDHMDGIKDVFEEFRPSNFWDIHNKCEKIHGFGNRYRREDWDFYKQLRAGVGINRLVLTSGDKGGMYNLGDNHDGLYVLSPTPALSAKAIADDDYNDASYVILYCTVAGRILFCGDSHDATWEHILSNHRALVKDVEVLIAPHHGRDSGRDRRFLDVIRPKLSLLGRAPSQHLMYDAWSNRNLEYLTAHSAGNIIVDADGSSIAVYVENGEYARRKNPFTSYNKFHQAWFMYSL